MLKRCIILTGDGKGKTSSAIGTLLRAIGHKMPCALYQFVKSPDSISGEILALQCFSDLCHIDICGMGFVPPFTSPDFSLHRLATYQGWERAKKHLYDEQTQVIVLDEIITALNCNLISLTEIYQTLTSLPAHKTVIITGRNAPQELIDLADTVSEVIPQKHGYEIGIKAQKGVEF